MFTAWPLRRCRHRVAFVLRQVESLRVILDSLQAKAKERQWLKHQTFGDLDDAKIVDGLTGERNVFRRRADRPPPPGAVQVKPKHLRLLVDASGSMYRFNGYDKRLERQMAAVLLFMEALDGHADKWRYDVVGHSGETTRLSLVDAHRPPADEKQRFDVPNQLRFLLLDPLPISFHSIALSNTTLT